MPRGRKKKVVEPIEISEGCPIDAGEILDEVKTPEPIIVNPEITGMTREQLIELLAEVDPKCGRGGCLHEKHKHRPGNSSQDECHLCSCLHFVQP